MGWQNVVTKIESFNFLVNDAENGLYSEDFEKVEDIWYYNFESGSISLFNDCFIIKDRNNNPFTVNRSCYEKKYIEIGS